MDKQEFIDHIRDEILETLDRCAKDFGLLGKNAGATDVDLPALFRALDAHAEKLWQRKIEQINRPFHEESVAILEGRACLISAKQSYLGLRELYA